MWWTAGLRRLAAKQRVRDGVGRCKRCARREHVNALGLRAPKRFLPGTRAILEGAGRGRVCSAWSKRSDEVSGRVPASQ